MNAIASIEIQSLIAGRYNSAVFGAPARELLTTAPHVFTERNHSISDIKMILDAHACLGVEISHGSFMLGMDLADAHWAIMRSMDIEPTISILDRPCITIPPVEKAETEAGQQLLRDYWDIYNSAEKIPGTKKGMKRDDVPYPLNPLVLRNELNATRGTFTPYDFKNTEGIEDDMKDLWLSPLNRHATMWRKGQIYDDNSRKVFEATRPDAPFQITLV